jgi:asparagine synthetase B (glutamine-hydrolysing)
VVRRHQRADTRPDRPPRRHRGRPRRRPPPPARLRGLFAYFTDLLLAPLVATLLSGGIDSGTVTYLAATGGLPVTPYSVATPWGDELADAAELSDHLGVALTPIRLTEEQIVGSIPEAVRRLGSADRLEKETGGTDRGALYEACFAELLADAGEGRLEPPTDPWELLERAVRRVGAVG